MSLDAVLRTGQRLQAEAPERFRLEAAGPLARAAEAPTGTIWVTTSNAYPRLEDIEVRVEECTDTEAWNNRTSIGMPIGLTCLKVKLLHKGPQNLHQEYFDNKPWIYVDIYLPQLRTTRPQEFDVHIYSTIYGKIKVTRNDKVYPDSDYLPEGQDPEVFFNSFALELFAHIARAARATYDSNNTTNHQMMKKQQPEPMKQQPEPMKQQPEPKKKKPGIFSWTRKR